jgi:hypothetical protein
VSAELGIWKRTAVLTLHAFALWLLCASVMGLGLAVLPLQTALIIHAIAAPIFAAGTAAVYASRHGDAGPLATASFFLAFVVLVDFFLVALAVNHSLEMFRSVLGTWLPFASIFAAALAAGGLVRRRPAPRADPAALPGPEHRAPARALRS